MTNSNLACVWRGGCKDTRTCAAAGCCQEVTLTPTQAPSKEIVHRVCQFLRDEIEIAGGSARKCQQCELTVESHYGQGVPGCVLRAQQLIEAAQPSHEPAHVPDQEFEHALEEYARQMSLWTTGSAAREGAKGWRDVLRRIFYARTTQPPAPALIVVGYVARKGDFVSRDFARPGECYSLSEGWEWMPVFQHTSPTKVVTPCNHSQWSDEKHGRYCPCGAMMWDAGD